ncbi:MAG: hypothetical protein AB8B48_04365 [Pseudomonadales bacterium]
MLEIDADKIKNSGENSWLVNPKAMCVFEFSQSVEGQKSYLEILIDAHRYIYPAIIAPIANQFLQQDFFTEKKVVAITRELIREKRTILVPRPEHVKVINSRGAKNHMQTTAFSNIKCRLMRHAAAMSGESREKHQAEFHKILTACQPLGAGAHEQALKQFDERLKYCPSY